MEGLIPREDEDHASTEEVPAGVAGRAMRLVHEMREEDSELSTHQAVQRIGSRVGVNADTLRG